MSTVRFSRRVFAAVLLLFPRWFRDQYGDDMMRNFVERSKAIRHRSGRAARLTFHIRSVLEVPGQAFRVRRKTGTSARGGAMESWMQELKIAARSLARRPGFALGVTLTLALGIGATTTVYTVVDGVMLRPLPYEEPSTLVAVGRLVPGAEWVDGESDLQDLRQITMLNYQGLRERTRSFETLATINLERLMRLPLGDGREEAVDALEVSSALFEMLGASPALGRMFLPEEYSAASRGVATTVAMITYQGWQRRYGGDPAVVGRPLGGSGAILVGVLPRDFRPLEAFFPDGYEIADFYLPSNADDLGLPGPEDGWRRVHALGRLSRGTSVEAARTEAESIAADLATEFPRANLLPDGSHIGIGLNELHSQTVGTTGRALGLFLGAAGLLLLLAAMNAATMLLARSLDRTRELGVRMALGAGRTRLVRLLVSEAGILAVVGGALGALLAYGGVGIFLRYAPSSIPRLSSVAVDARVLAVAAVVSLGTGVAAGLLPALRLTRQGPWERLQRGGRSFAEPTWRLRGVLVGGQMTVAIVLLSGAGLLFNSFVRISTVDPGFKPDGLITMTQRLKSSSAFDLREGPHWQGWDVLLDELRAIPGVESVGGTTGIPFQSPWWAPRLLLPGDTPDTWREGIAGYIITPGYLETMAIELLDGRDLERLDGPDAEAVALVNHSFVRTQLGGGDPIDVVVRLADRDGEIPMRIVGVVEDVVQRRAEEGFRPAIYVPYTQHQRFSGLQAAVRTTLATDAILPDVRRVAAWFNSLQPTRDLVTMRDRMATTRTSPLFQTMLIGAFALVATLLAAAGLYGSLAHSVGRRQRELGIRMALGADRAGVLRMVLGQGMRLSLAGLTVGMIAALLSTRVLAGFLYGVEPNDPATLLMVGAVLVLVSAGACLAPARRATAIDPVTVLKAE